MDLRAIFSPDRDKYLRELKNSLINGTLDCKDDNYEQLVDEWRRSWNSSIPYDTTFLTHDQRDFYVFERVSTITKFKFSYLDDFCRKREAALSELGCAIFHLDSELAVFRAAGNKELLDELRSKGVRHGTKFTEESVGVFVANIAKESPHSTICRVGDENYLKLFTDYVCFARYEEEAFRDFWGVNLILAPKELYTNFLRAEVSFLISVLDLTNMLSYPFLENQHMLLGASQYASNEMTLMLDVEGNVVFTSSEFEKEFGKKAWKGPHENISTFMSELVFIKKYLASGEDNVIKELLLTNGLGRPHFYSVGLKRLSTGKSCSGIKVIFQSIQQKKSGSSKSFGQEIKHTFSCIMGETEKIKELKALGQQVSANTSNVLIQGESGTGKELFAQSIHALNTKRTGPFVPINCAAIPQELINSELFGYEGGAFTGALKGGHAGKFEQANNGTIFLDEISEMPLGMQGSLLRVLEDSVVSRVGGDKYIPLDVRVISATNKDLWQCVQNGTFRADLYFRLNIVKLAIPPLRERIDDMEILIDHMISDFSRKGMCSNNIKFMPDVLCLFKKYNWPGNVRELRNIVERCVNACQQDKQYSLSLQHVPNDIIELMSSDMCENTITLPQNWKKHSKDRVENLMLKYNGNKSQVAKEMGISRGTLYKKMREYGM